MSGSKILTEEERLNYKPTRTFENISGEAKDLKDNYEQRVNLDTLDEIRSEDLGHGLDDMRYLNKKMLSNFAADNYQVVHNEEVNNLLMKLSDYAAKDITASSSSDTKYTVTDLNEPVNNTITYFGAIKSELNEESRLFEEIYNESKKLYHEFDSKLKDADEEEMGQEKYDELMNNIRITSNLLMYFEGQRDGHLEPTPKKALTVDARGRNVVQRQARNVGLPNDTYVNKNVSAKDVPLFTHDPSPNDLKQGGMGDCYLLSGLSQLAARHPEKIKEMIRENDDHTVTVRFFRRKYDEEKGPGVNDTFEPVYVTVDKMVMSDTRLNGATNNMWAQMIERAYISSGLLSSFDDYSVRKQNGLVTNDTYFKYNRSVPENIDELYAKYSKLPPTKWPSHEECPWLIDFDGNLHKYEIKMDNIQGNLAASFLETVMGPEYEAETMLLRQDEPNAVDYIEELAIESMKASGKTLSDKDLTKAREKIRKEFTKSTLDGVDCVTKIVFESITGKKAVTYPDGTFIASNEAIIQNGGDPLQSVANQLVMDAVFTCNKRVNLDLNTGHGLGFKAINRELKEAYENGRKILGNDGDGDVLARKEIFKNNKAMYEKILNLSESAGRNLSLSMYGRYGTEVKYTANQEEMFENMRKAIENGNLVTAGTKKGINENIGVIETHAYSVQRVFSEMVDGHEIKYVEVRNPHGYHGSRYVESDDFGFEMVNDYTSEGGAFKVELADFFRTYSNVGINSAPNREKELQDKKSLDVQVADRYGKILHSFNMILKESNLKRQAGSAPKELTEFHQALIKFRREVPILTGLNVSDLPLSKEYKELNKKSNELINHLNNKGKLSPEDLKALQVAKACNRISFMISENELDPLEIVKEEVASRIIDNLGREMLLSKDPQVKSRWERVLNDDDLNEGVAKIIANSPEFNKILGDKSFTELDNISDKDINAVVSNLKKNASLDSLIDNFKPVEKDVSVVAPAGDINVKIDVNNGSDTLSEVSDLDKLMAKYEANLKAIEDNLDLSPEARKMEKAIAESGYELSMLELSLGSPENADERVQKREVLKPSLCKYLARVTLNKYLQENPEYAKEFSDEKNIQNMAKELANSKTIDSLLDRMLENKDSFKNLDPDKLYHQYLHNEGDEIKEELGDRKMAAHDRYQETYNIAKTYGTALYDSRGLSSMKNWGLTPVICNQVNSMAKDLKGLNLTNNSIQAIAFGIMVGKKNIPVEDILSDSKEMANLRKECAKEASLLVIGNKVEEVSANLMKGMKALNDFMLPYGNEIKEFIPKELIRPNIFPAAQAGEMLNVFLKETNAAFNLCKNNGIEPPFTKETLEKESRINDQLTSTFAVPLKGPKAFLKQAFEFEKRPDMSDLEYYKNFIGDYVNSMVYETTLKALTELPENQGKNPATLPSEDFAKVCHDTYTSIITSDEFKDFTKFVLSSTEMLEKFNTTVTNGSFLTEWDLKINLNPGEEKAYSCNFDKLKKAVKEEVIADPLANNKTKENTKEVSKEVKNEGFALGGM